MKRYIALINNYPPVMLKEVLPEKYKDEPVKSRLTRSIRAQFPFLSLEEAHNTRWEVIRPSE